MVLIVTLFVFFFFKQKTAYEMRISDWSSDVCSSDLTTISDSRKLRVTVVRTAMKRDTDKITGKAVMLENVARPSTTSAPMAPLEIGRASCRERVCQYV